MILPYFIIHKKKKKLLLTFVGTFFVTYFLNYIYLLKNIFNFDFNEVDNIFYFEKLNS